LLQQTTRAIKSRYQNDGTSQTISLELHPSELGQLKIHIERKKNRLTATIVASQIVAEEMLNHEREELLQALRELGLGEAQVEIVYGGAEENRDQTLQPLLHDQDLASRPQAAPNGENASKQATLQRGVNFVA
jgi:flagellar hook-length control protein FliK